MYEIEFKFLQDHIDLVENNKFEELFSIVRATRGINWENILKICFDPDIDINPLEGLTKIPDGFFSLVSLPEVNLVIPKSISAINGTVFYEATFKTLGFENPDCKFELNRVHAELITLPANSDFSDNSSNYLSNIDAKVVLSKKTDYLSRDAIRNRSENLILIWTADSPVKMAIEYTPKNKNTNWWHVTKNNLHIRR